MLPSEIANPNIILLYLQEFRNQSQASLNQNVKHMGFLRLCMKAYKSPAHLM